MPNESTTWETTSASVASTPSASTTSAGAIVIAGAANSGMRRSMKPCITTWPAYVPTLELESPEASSATAKASAAPPPISRSKPACAPSMVSMPVLPALVEQRGRDDEHRQVDHAREAHRDRDVEALEAQQRAPLGVVARQDPALHSAPCR